MEHNVFGPYSADAASGFDTGTRELGTPSNESLRIKRHTAAFSTCSGHAKPSTAKAWLQAFGPARCYKPNAAQYTRQTGMPK